MIKIGSVNGRFAIFLLRDELFNKQTRAAQQNTIIYNQVILHFNNFS